jgi:hypothetical protein
MRFRALPSGPAYTIYFKWIDANGGYRKIVRAAMKWWRGRNPEESRYARPMNHPWYGSILWTTKWEARALCSMAQVVCGYAGHRAEDLRMMADGHVRNHEAAMAAEPNFPHVDITTCQCPYAMEYRHVMDLAAKAAEVAALLPEEKP